MCVGILALVIRHANGNFHASHCVSCVVCLGVSYFSTLALNRCDFRGGKKKEKGGGEAMEHKMCVLIFSDIFV